MTKYRARFDDVVAIEVERETAAFVVIDGRRSAKRSDWESFFDSRAEAVAHLIGTKRRGVAMANSRAEAEQESLDKLIKKFTP